MSHGIFVDTNVLIYALQEETPEETTAIKSARHVLNSAERVVVSSMSVFEVERGILDADRPRWLEKRGLLTILPDDARVSELAARLYQAHKGQDRVCTRCLSSEKTLSCESCGRNRAKASRLNDAIIVACAATQFTGTSFYSCDTDISALADLLPGLRVNVPWTVYKPEHPDGPLFALKEAGGLAL